MLNFLLRGMQPSADDIEPAEAHQRLSKGAMLIDVREVHEWVDGHVVGARHIPLGQLHQHLPKLPRDREILFICRSGNRSSSATAQAKRAGLQNARNVRGGMQAWMQANLPSKRGK